MLCRNHTTTFYDHKTYDIINLFVCLPVVEEPNETSNELTEAQIVAQAITELQEIQAPQVKTIVFHMYLGLLPFTL